MSVRSSIAAVFVLALSLSVTGCGSDSPGKAAPTGAASAGGTPTPASTPTPAASPSAPATGPAAKAAKALKDLQVTAAELEVIKIVSRVEGSAKVGLRTGVSNLKSGDFTTTLAVAGGKLTMQRHGDLTWTKAPAAYWVGLGYTKASAREAGSKWVVGPVEKVKPMLTALDPGGVVRGLLDRRAADVTSVAKVSTGPLRGNRVLIFRQADAVQRVYLTNGANPQLLRVSSTTKGTTTTVDFLAAPRAFSVRTPAASDVLQGS